MKDVISVLFIISLLVFGAINDVLTTEQERISIAIFLVSIVFIGGLIELCSNYGVFG